MTTPLAEACEAQDAALRSLGLEVWVGGEPTFTDRSSQDPWWLTQAEGGGKEARAVRVLRHFLATVASGGEACRAVGRQYPGEARPRFCFGARWRRADERREPPPAVVSPPGPDPLLDAVPLSVLAPRPHDAWLTVTPDPGVVEVNLPPAPDLATFARYVAAAHAAAADAGLHAVRWRYNGDATDSGGGGQLTFGGKTPEESPFLRELALLPRLVRYHANHPALSYAFAPECAGSAGQGPRPDEGVRERVEELAVALDHADALPPASAAELWERFAPLLVDASGNTHRAELNIEKLWNPYFGARGRLGVVELRSLRMPPDVERMVAVAALFRGVVARCARAPYQAALPDHGAALHDRLALPAFLEADLRAVLADLAAHGLALPPPLAGALLAAPPELARCAAGDATLTLTPAQEFWPLHGDVASQEQEGARLVDASSARLQVLVTAPAGDPGRVAAAGFRIPLQALGDGRHVGAVRYRAFAPRPGLHPGLAPHDPLVLDWTRGGQTLRIAAHGWRPQGGAYPGLPHDGAEAERRRRERVVVTQVSAAPEPRPAPAGGLTVDLRRLPRSP